MTHRPTPTTAHYPSGHLVATFLDAALRPLRPAVLVVPEIDLPVLDLLGHFVLSGSAFFVPVAEDGTLRKRLVAVGPHLAPDTFAYRVHVADVGVYRFTMTNGATVDLGSLPLVAAA